MQPAFELSDRPGLDFNQIGHFLTGAANYVRKGKPDIERLAQILERLSVNAQHACRQGHDMEFRLLHAERLLSPQLGGLEGKPLTRAIKEASQKLSTAERAKRRAMARAERAKR